MKFLVLLGVAIGGIWLLSSLVLAAILWKELRLKQSAQEKGQCGPAHEHDCLAHECDFHPDGEVYNLMRAWLVRHKLNGVIVTESALKECALNLFIAEVRERRPLMGENGDVQ